MARLFVGIGLPEEVVAELAAMCTGIEGARWEKPEKMHLTLAFLGQVEDVGEVEAALEQVEAPSFEARMSGVGTFGRRRSPRVLWAGMRQGAEALAEVKQAVDAALAPTGYVPERRRFHAHATLARFKRPPRRDELEAWRLRHEAYASAPFTVDRVRLYRSTLTPRGSVYDVVAERLLSD